MSKNVKCNFKELKDFEKQIQKLGDNQDKFIEACAKELAARCIVTIDVKQKYRKKVIQVV